MSQDGHSAGEYCHYRYILGPQPAASPPQATAIIIVTFTPACSLRGHLRADHSLGDSLPVPALIWASQFPVMHFSQKAIYPALLRHSAPCRSLSQLICAKTGNLCGSQETGSLRTAPRTNHSERAPFSKVPDTGQDGGGAGLLSFGRGLPGDQSFSQSAMIWPWCPSGASVTRRASSKGGSAWVKA